MGKKAGAGYSVGAKKIDVEEYLPEPGDWEETNVIFDFGDGWLICEDRTTYDRKLMAVLTKTCVGNFKTYYPPPSEEEITRDLDEMWEKNLQWYKNMGEKALETEKASFFRSRRTQYNAPAVHRLFHVRDPEGRPRACILAIRADWETQKKPGQIPPAYTTSRDLAQKHPINIEGMDCHICEVRLGTGRTAPVEALARVVHWYKEATGEWDQKAFEKHDPAPYTAINGKRDGLDKYRCKPPKKGDK